MLSRHPQNGLFGPPPPPPPPPPPSHRQSTTRPRHPVCPPSFPTLVQFSFNDHLRIHTTISCTPSPSLTHFIAYALHHTILTSAVTFAALYLLQRLKMRFIAARGSFGHRLSISALMIASKVIPTPPVSHSNVSSLNAPCETITCGGFIPENPTKTRDLLVKLARLSGAQENMYLSANIFLFFIMALARTSITACMSAADMLP